MSVASHRKYMREEKAKEDKQQAILSTEGIAPNPQHYAMKTDVIIFTEKKVTCPFCLGLEQFGKFLTSTKKGFSHSDGKCPLCGQGMRLKTLLQMGKMTAREYAEWVQPYSHSGFFQKIDYTVWKNRLKLMGWTEEFWDRYNELKATDTHESYEKHMEKAQEEWRARENVS